MIAEILSEAPVLAWMRWAAEHSLWEMLNTAILLAVSATGVIFFWAKRRVRNLNFFTRCVRDQSEYPLKIYLELRNYTGRSVVISSPFFVCTRLRPDPNARGDSPSGKLEIKFPDRSNTLLTEVEYLLRHRENVSTWMPIDPAHSNEEVNEAIKRRHVGKFHCMCTWLQEKPKIHKLIIRI
jgi:hypothetical protein